MDDKFAQRYNPELILPRRLTGTEYEEALLALIREHYAKTGSQRAKMLLDDWAVQRQFFWHVMPKEDVVAIESATEGSDEHVSAQDSVVT